MLLPAAFCIAIQACDPGISTSLCSTFVRLVVAVLFESFTMLCSVITAYQHGLLQGEACPALLYFGVVTCARS